MSARQPRIMIIGAGFGGLRAAKTLSKAGAKVLLMDQNNYHLFQPLLYQVATAGLEPEQIARPVRPILARQKNVQFIMARVEDVDLSSKHVKTKEGVFPYDYLVIAVGAETYIPEIPGLGTHALPLKELMDAIRIRNHLLRCLERASLQSSEKGRQALLSVSVAGAGPTGVEMAGALSELLGMVQRRDYPHLERKDFRVILVEKAQWVLPGFPERLRVAASNILERKGVELKLDRTVKGFDGQNLELDHEEVIPCATLVWCGGVKGSSLLQKLGLPISADGRVVVEPTLQVPGHPEVSVIGDSAYFEEEGHPLPMMAPVAIQMGELAAKNILRNSRRQPPLLFRYRNPGLLATIGRNAAVAKVHGLEFKGFTAWFVWLLVHLLAIVGFRNRLMVLINWAWDYLFYEREDRIIVRFKD